MNESYLIRRRVGFSILTGLGLIGILSLFASIIAYFNSGADTYEFENFNDKLFESHQPRVIVSFQEELNLTNNNPVLKSVVQSYIDAWHVINTSLNNRSETLLEDYFERDLSEYIIQGIHGGLYDDIRLIQTDIDHNIQISLISYDKQFASLEDSCVQLVKQAYDTNGELLWSRTYTYTINVNMVFREGRWRVSHWISEAHSCDNQITEVSGEKVRSFDNIKGVNYYPSANPWFSMWENFSIDTIQRDFATVAELGFNSVRIFLPFEFFDDAENDAEHLDYLLELVNLAQENNLYVIPALFDFNPSYSIEAYSKCDRYLENISQKIGNHPSIIAWDLKNEADLDFDVHGEKNVMTWLEFIRGRLRMYLPEAQVMVGWSRIDHIQLGNQFLDILSFHYYDDPKRFNQLLAIHDIKKINKPVFLGEFGMSTFKKWYYPIGQNSKDQLELFETLYPIVSENDMSFAVWTLYDFQEVPKYVVGSSPWRRWVQRKYGLLTESGDKKRAAVYLEQQLQPSKN
ncbi:MAG: cellulase family glycosylhydrolase [Saprospiraceae bacterium]|nr:cellulase family glycosylhydrolase [Saprospiraceae bacterium]